MLLGVLTVPAQEVRIDFAVRRPSVLVPAVVSPQLPGLRFLAVDVPTWQIRRITALGAQGQPLATTNWPY
jgi:hypothetical protein